MTAHSVKASRAATPAGPLPPLHAFGEARSRAAAVGSCRPAAPRAAVAQLPLLLALLALGAPRRAAATTCAAGTYSYNSGTCAACPAGVASFVAATGLCAPAAAPADTAFFLSGTSAEGVAAFPAAPSASYVSGVFGADNGALSFASGANFLAVTPAAGSALLAALPTGNAPFTASAWLKCSTGGFMSAVSWGVPATSGATSQTSLTRASSKTSLTLTAGPAYFNSAGSAGTVSTLASGFNSLQYVATDASGNVLVGDIGVKKVSPGGAVSTLALGPAGSVAVDAAGNVIVADLGNNAVKKISPDGAVSTLASIPYAYTVAGDATGNVIVADYYNTVKKISPDGAVSTLASGLNGVRGAAVDAAGNVFVADDWAGAIKKISPSGAVSTLVVTSVFTLAIDAAGSVFFSAYESDTVTKISSGGALSTVANGLGAIRSVAVDVAGNVIVADIRSGAVKVIIQTATQTTCDSAWHHVAVTHGGSTSSATLTYLDGALIASTSQTFAIPSDGSAVLSINSNGAASNSAGAVSDVRLYSRALSAAEVLALSQPPLATFANTAAAPAAPVLGATSYAFSCAAGSAGASTSLIRNLDRSWAWAGGITPVCSQCLAGSSSGPGSPSCSPCPPGTYSLAGAAACTPCPYGTFGSRAGLATAACSGACAVSADCPAGTAYPPPALCAAGSWSSLGAAACSPCPPGTYSLAGAAACSPCPYGTYGSRAGLATAACSGVCAVSAACPAGTAYPPPAAGSALSCAATGSRAVPGALGLQLWPAAAPGNTRQADLVVAPLAACQALTGATDSACGGALSVVGTDGVARFAVGTAAQLHMQAAATMTCSST